MSFTAVILASVALLRQVLIMYLALAAVHSNDRARRKSALRVLAYLQRGRTTRAGRDR